MPPRKTKKAASTEDTAEGAPAKVAKPKQTKATKVDSTSAEPQPNVTRVTRNRPKITEDEQNQEAPEPASKSKLKKNAKPSAQTKDSENQKTEDTTSKGKSKTKSSTQTKDPEDIKTEETSSKSKSKAKALVTKSKDAKDQETEETTSKAKSKEKPLVTKSKDAEDHKPEETASKTKSKPKPSTQTKDAEDEKTEETASKAKSKAKPSTQTKDPEDHETEETASKPKLKTKAKPSKQTKRGKVAKSEPEPASEDEKTDDNSDFEEPVAKKKKAPAKKAEGKENKSKKSDTKVPLKNATNTKWESIDFSCAKKTSGGKESNFHITSWNVDGVRAWLKKGGLDIINHDKPDILCLQEVKVSEGKVPEEMKVEGYEVLWKGSDKEGYAGVAILTKVKPLNVNYGIGDQEQDIDGRCITAEYEKFYLVNVYVPNAGRKLVTLSKRLDWNKIFKDYIKSLNESKPVIICGDMNVAHTEIDLTNPKTNTKNAGFTPEEREGMSEFLKDGYIDAYRHFYPDQKNAYTFWSYMSNARAKNIGWRLDYFIVSDKFIENVCDTIIFADVLGSDHCPLSLHLSL